MTTESLTLLLIGAGFASGSLAALALGLARRRRYRQWADAGTEVEGKVVDIREYYAGDAVRHDPLVEYRDREGVSHRGYGQSNRGLGVGAVVQLVYDPEDPESIILSWDVDRTVKIVKLLAAVFGVLGAGLIALAVA